MATILIALSAQYRLRLEVQQANQDVSINASAVDMQLYVDKLSGSGFFTFDTSYWSLTIDGNVVASGSIGGYDFRGYSTLLLGTSATLVTHNADGQKTVAVSGGFSAAGNVGSGTASGSLALTRIPRGPFYGAGGEYRRTLAYYGTGGSYRQCLVYYGSGGTWNLAGG